MADMNEEESKYHSRLIINKTKQVGFNVIFATVFAITTFIIAGNITLEAHWGQLIIPIVLINLPVILFPLVQNWSYEPWQAKAQKYETHYTD